MNKKVWASVVIFGLLLVSVVELSAVKLAAGNFLPESPPGGIHITEAGDVEGTTLIQRNGNTYKLIGDIEGTISILCDGIVLDGAGHTLEGSGSGVGVFLQERCGVTVENLKIQNFQFGIKSTWYSYGAAMVERANTVSANTLTNNTYGIYINDFSSGNKLLGNTASDNTYGIWLDSCGNNLLRDNRLENNSYNFFVKGGSLSKSINDVDQSNTVNGAPIIYWTHETGKTVPKNAGYVALVDCSDITVENLDLTHNGQGILLAGVTNSKITANKITQSTHGIWLVESENNRLEGNTLDGVLYEGIYMPNSNHNQITGNTFIGGGLAGTQAAQVTGLTGRAAIRLYQSSNNQICTNQFVGNGEGITLHDSQDNAVTANIFEETQGSAIHIFSSDNNSISENDFKENDCAIYIWSSNSTVVSENIIAKNQLGILIDTGAENKILRNNITDNVGFGLQLKSVGMISGGSQNNVIHHNNFINNQPEGLDVSIPAVMGDLIRSEGRMPEVEWLPGLGNIWDDGKEGNYWGDYLSRYPDAGEVANSGVGDAAYVINENNLDRYPLLSPVNLSAESTSPQQQKTIESTDNSMLNAPVIPPVVIAAVISGAVALIVGLMLYRKKKLRG